MSERVELIEDIWGGIADETPNQLNLSSADRAELHRRLAEHQADPSSSIPWSEVRASLFNAQN